MKTCDSLLIFYIFCSLARQKNKKGVTLFAARLWLFFSSTKASQKREFFTRVLGPRAAFDISLISLKRREREREVCVSLFISRRGDEYSFFD